MSQTECVARFTSHGREFMVLHKVSAAYLRADGRMIASLGESLDIDEAITQAHLQTELFQINERAQETTLLHRLYEKPRTNDIKAIAADHVLIKPAMRTRCKAGYFWAVLNLRSSLKHTLPASRPREFWC